MSHYPMLVVSERLVSPHNEKVYTELRIHQLGDSLYDVRKVKYAPAWSGGREGDRSEFSLIGGVARWVSNNRVLMMDVVRDNCIDKVPGFSETAHRSAYAVELDVFLRDYREKSDSPSLEELTEMRAAFGVGVEVVNVLSGVRTKL